MEKGVRMKAYCPNKCEEEQFVTTAHVVEDWVVTPEGDWIETIECTEVSHGPNTGNIWTCHTCGEEAKWNIERD